MFFMPSEVFCVDPDDRSLDTQSNIDNFNPVDVIEDPAREFYSHGVGKLALAAFAYAYDEEGVSYMDLLVVEHNNDMSLLVPSQLVAEQPDDYLTIDLARKFATLEPAELAQLNVPETILDHAAKRYPNLTPISKNN